MTIMSEDDARKLAEQKSVTGSWLPYNRVEAPINWRDELAKLELKRMNLHNYIIMKLEEHDYHAVQDAGSDLREIDARSKAIKEWIEAK